MDYASGRLARLRARGDARPAPAEALLAALPTPLLVVDEGGVILDANAAAETLLNLSRSVIVGMPIANATGHHLRSMPAETPFVAYGPNRVDPALRAADIGALRDRIAQLRSSPGTTGTAAAAKGLA